MTDEHRGAGALAALRAHRQAARTGEIDRFDVFYQAYVTALFAGFVLVLLSGWVGGDTVSVSRAALATHGTAALGLVSAAAIGAGLRSGSRGGPLALEAVDVRHVLLAPIARRDALRGPALRQLRTLAAGAALVGAVGGRLAAHRLPGDAPAWMAAGITWCVATAVAAVAAGWLAAGSRLPAVRATLLATALVAAAAAELAGWLPFAPTHPLGLLGTAPLAFRAAAPASMLVVARLAWWGLQRIERVSVELLARRSSLVAELRFAATMRDLRTVMLLRRQLHQERARQHPRLQLPTGRARTLVVQRDLRALLRTPTSRLVRLGALTAGAAAAGVGVWNGSRALILVAGLCSFLAGLEALEPLAEEVDRSTFLDLAPVPRGTVLLRHTIVPCLVLAALSACAAGVLAVFTRSPGGGSALVMSAVAAPLTSVAGAAINILRDANGPANQAIEQLMLPPEAVGMRLIYRLVWPPAVATAGFAPVYAAQQAVERGSDPSSAASSLGTVAVLLALGVAAWIRHRDDLRSSWSAASASATSTGAT